MVDCEMGWLMSSWNGWITTHSYDTLQHARYKIKPAKINSGEVSRYVSVLIRRHEFRDMRSFGIWSKMVMRNGIMLLFLFDSGSVCTIVNTLQVL